MKSVWQTKKLGEVCAVIGGGTPPKGRADFYSGDIHWATVRDMRREVISETEFKITKEAVRSSSTNVIPKGNVVIATRVGLGKVCLLEHDTAINQDLRGIIPQNLQVLSVGFLFWWLKSIAHVIEEEGTGATVKGVKLPFIKSLPIPLPPLPEQHRIVAILDEAFTGIATAKANAKTNLKNARELFESYLNSIFMQKWTGWVEKRIGDVANTQYGLSEPMNEEGKGFKIFRMGEVQDGRLIDTGLMKFADINQVEFEKYKLQKGDVLFNRTNSYELVGKTGIFDMLGNYCFASYLVRVLPNRNALLPEFLNYFMNSKIFQYSVKQKASKSINQANINATILSNESIRFPESTKEQKIIVTNLDSIRAETKRLESLYQKKLLALDELKQSLLHQAFTGQLSGSLP